jgi:hypothetical protein
VIPDSLLPEVIALAHEGHPDIELTLRNLRDRVWFPNMNKLVTEYVATCLGCTAAVPFNPPAPIVNRETPEGPWKVCAADYKGPIGGPIVQSLRSCTQHLTRALPAMAIQIK